MPALLGDGAMTLMPALLGDGARTLMPALRPDGRACQPDNEVRAFQAEALWSWRR